MKMTIRRADLEIMLLCLTFYETNIVPHYLFLLFKYVLLIYLFARHFFNIYSEKLLYAFIFLYGGVTTFSTAINHLPENTVVAAAFYMIQIIVIFITVQSYLKKYSLKDLINCVVIIFLFLCIFTDVLMLFVEYNFENSSEHYFIGSKFAVSYLHCFTLAMMCFLNDRRRRHFIFSSVRIAAFSIMSVLVIIHVHCTTGIVAILASILLLILPKSKLCIFMSEKVLIIVTSVMNFLIFGSYSLLTTPVIQDMVINVFHKSANLTGRLQIYKIIILTIQKRFFIGYGYFNNVIENILSYGNAQNGIMKILIDSGFLGLIGYIGIVYFGINKRYKDETYWPFFVFLYIMIVASAVEINLTHMLVFFTIAIISGSGKRIKINRRAFNEKETENNEFDTKTYLINP